MDDDILIITKTQKDWLRTLVRVELEFITDEPLDKVVFPEGSLAASLLELGKKLGAVPT